MGEAYQIRDQKIAPEEIVTQRNDYRGDIGLVLVLGLDLLQSFYFLYLYKSIILPLKS
jgi:hypothetical protein